MTARDKNQPIPLPITRETAIAWFRQTKSSKFPGEATDGDVSSFVKIVNDLPAYTERELKVIDPELPIEQLIEFDELNATEFKEVLSFQHALTTLRQKLPDVINIIQRNDMDPLGLHRLKQLEAALTNLTKDAAYFFDRSKPGGRDQSWHVHAHVLRPRIEGILRKLGRAQISVKPNGPLVLVLALALKATTGRKLAEHTISTELNRARRRRGSRSRPKP